MTSFRQWQANRRNAGKSTGPVTEEGKQRSRCNAVRHGLTAETVIDALVDAEDYQAFEAAIIADYDAQSSVERELVLRLASLLWRLRRATALEAGLFQIHNNPGSELEGANARSQPPLEHVLDTAVGSQAGSGTRPNAEFEVKGRHNNARLRECISNRNAESFVRPGPKFNSDIARCFMRLANVNDGAFERIGRCETALWRQSYQVIFMLDVLRRRNIDLMGLASPRLYVTNRPRKPYPEGNTD